MKEIIRVVLLDEFASLSFHDLVLTGAEPVSTEWGTVLVITMSPSVIGSGNQLTSDKGVIDGHRNLRLLYAGTLCLLNG
jgi:hypothetical protein